MGKALWEDTPIPTPHGIKPLRDIHEGDQVYDEHGIPVTVLFKTERQLNRKCYKLSFSNKETIIADEDHLWKIDGYSEPLTTKQLYMNSGKKTITLPHKLNDVKYLEIMDIEPTKSVPVYCLEVNSPTHLFLVGESGIPTHNCVTGDTKIKIRNKKTGEVKEVAIRDFHRDMI